jgi:uncharacterized membrane protein
VTDQSLRIGLAAVGALGLAIAGYLTVVHARGALPVCMTSGCETMQRSRYAELAGIPIAALGLATYAALLGSTVTRARLAVAGAATLASAAAAFAAYLVYVQVAVLHSVCSWCVASDALTLAAAVVAWLRLRASLK